MHRNSLELAEEVITLLADKSGVSGYEHRIIPFLDRVFGPYDVELSTDFIGNYYIRKKGLDSSQTVMLAAHLDEIGLIVTHIDSRGFLHFAAVGGIDQRTLLNQEVTIHGEKDIKGVICAAASSQKEQGKNEAIELTDLVIDCGYLPEMVKSMVNPGDIISIYRSPLVMLNKRITGKALDDRAGIAVMAVCINELSRLKHFHTVMAVATVQEEVGLRGAITGTDNLLPDIAVAIDVTHAQTLDTKNQVAVNLGQGPVLALGPNIKPEIFTELQKAAEENKIPFQLQPVAGPTGTDARVIQLAGQGIPTGLISIPLRYMHTSVETASLQDITDCGKLLAHFIASLPEDLEVLSCS